MFHPPFLALFQSHMPQVFLGSSFMQSMYRPSSNLANWEFTPKYPLHRLSPTAQLLMSLPRTGRVTVKTPPVQLSQQPPSVTAKGVYGTEITWQGLTEVRWLLIHRMGRDLVQGWSPSNGLQLLHEKRPAQLFSQEGKTVAWMVSPLCSGCRVEGTEDTTACALVRATTANRVTAHFSLFIQIYNASKNICGLINSPSRGTGQPAGLASLPLLHPSSPHLPICHSLPLLLSSRLPQPPLLRVQINAPIKLPCCSLLQVNPSNSSKEDCPPCRSTPSFPVFPDPLNRNSLQITVS